MKFKKTLITLFLLSLGGSLYLFFQSSPLYSSLKIEVLNNYFPEKPDDDRILPFGYTLGPWPKDFRGEPIVTKLTYKKGPPLKFIDTLTQIWRPVEVELAITGPKTVVPGFKINEWRTCYEIDRFAVIVPNGSVQVFSLKSILNGPGIEARESFLKIMGSLKVNEDLANSRAWIEGKIKGVNLERIKKIPNLKERFEKLILVQNWIFSYLSINPTELDSFYHLAGITHRLAMDLLKTRDRVFENQEAWILNFHPLLSTLIRYAKDFSASETRVKSMEALLEDFLLKQSKLSR